jgi:predicted SnoaL-like aldol condensation-catalyzing enzyme
MDIEEAKEVIENYFTHYIDENPELALAVSIVLTELKKKDKVINEMAECIGQDIRCVRPEIECNKMTHDCRDCIKEYFTNQVEREGK